MRRERPEIDLPLDEERPERESGGGRERDAEEETSGVERETPGADRGEPGVESPPADADRAGLLP